MLCVGEQELLEKAAANITKVYYFVLRQTGNSDLSEEIAQESFYRCSENLRRGNITNEKTLESGAYLAGIAENLLHDYRRRNKKFKCTDFYSSRWANLDGVRTPLAILLEKERHEQIAAALSRLPERSREVVRLKYQEGLTHKEIARIMSVCMWTVSRDHSTAIQKLKQALSK